MAFPVKGGGSYELPDEGLHDAVLCDVIDLGIVDGGFGPKHQVKLRWQLDTLNKGNKRFLVSQRYTSSIHKKAKLGQQLETWRGKKFTDEERRKGFDLEKLLGVCCQLSIVHNESGGSTYANVGAILPPQKHPQTKKPWWDHLQVLDYQREKDRPQEAVTAQEAAASADDPFGALPDPPDNTPLPPNDDDVPF